MREISEGIFQFPSGEIYRDEEWIKAWSVNEKRTYYKCQMLMVDGVINITNHLLQS